MQYRITLSVAFGLTVILALFAYLAVSALVSSRKAAEEERLGWARAMTIHVDDVIQRVANRTSLVADFLAEDWQDPGFDVEKSILRYSPYLSGSRLAIFKIDGSLLWTNETVGDDAASLYDVPAASEALRRSASALDTCYRSGQQTICIAAPVRGSFGNVRGILVRQLDLNNPELNFLPTPQLGTSAHAGILSHSGIVLAADTQELVGSRIHASALADFVQQGIAGVRIHEPVSGHGHIVAYSPLTTLPGWGVTVEQEADVALAIASNLRERIILFGLVALAVAAALAWFDVRQVVRPLGLLTDRAARMAAGELETPITSSRQDEVGILARTLEGMRLRLKESLQELEVRDRELEQRVQERTGEVRQLVEELRNKEQARSRLLEKVISAQEEERKRIARELHDESAQVLATLLVELGAAAEVLPSNPGQAASILERAKVDASRALAEMRQMILDLRPSALDDLGLVAAVQWYARTRLEQAGTKVQLAIGGTQRRVPPTVETALFRIAQEAINNVAKHAHASSVRVRLQLNRRQASLVIEDDGEGFDVDAGPAIKDGTEGLGLMGMRERAALLGGTATITSKPGRGTQLSVHIPLDGQDA